MTFTVNVMGTGTFVAANTTFTGLAVVTGIVRSGVSCLPVGLPGTLAPPIVLKVKVGRFVSAGVLAGDRIVTIGNSVALAGYLGLPVSNHLVERGAGGEERPVPREKFYIPASLLEVAVDSTATSARGLGSKAIVMFDESPVLRLGPDAAQRGVRRVAWYATDRPLRSGWAMGQGLLKDGVAAAEATVGKGTLYLYGPEIAFRSQPHGTFKFLFNPLIGE